jgi:hypothetical protein
MGFFSWKTADTQESIPVWASSRPTFTVHVQLPDGRETLVEERYDGYGHFNGRDFFGLVIEINDIARPRKGREHQFDEKWRTLGISLHYAELDGTTPSLERFSESVKRKCNRIRALKRPRITRYPAAWTTLPDNQDCPWQGYFYECT